MPLRGKTEQCTLGCLYRTQPQLDRTRCVYAPPAAPPLGGVLLEPDYQVAARRHAPSVAEFLGRFRRSRRARTACSSSTAWRHGGGEGALCRRRTQTRVMEKRLFYGVSTVGGPGGVDRASPIHRRIEKSSVSLIINDIIWDFLAVLRPIIRVSSKTRPAARHQPSYRAAPPAEHWKRANFPTNFFTQTHLEE